MNSATPDPRYPVGRFLAPDSLSASERATLIAQIEACPAELRRNIEALSEAQLDTPYREGGWTGRQVVHHLLDSHLNGYLRFRWGLTEEDPEFKGYDQDRWAALVDSRTFAVELSLDVLDNLHRRWGEMLRTIDDAAWRRRGRTAKGDWITLDGLLALYAWHGRHHTAHVAALADR